MSKAFWFHAALTLAGTLVTIFTPAVQQFAAHHIVIAVPIMGVWASIGAALNPRKDGSN